MEIPEILAEEKKREAAYRLLAQCYAQPGESLHEAVAGLSSIYQEGDQEILQALAEMRAAISGEGLQALQVEHARLFIGPFELLAPPYGSVYLEGSRRVMGDSTVAVVRAYRDAGLRLREDVKDAPDHIAVELEFVGFLTALVVKALDRGDLEAAHEAALRRSAFLEAHLGAWAERFALTVLENSISEFYRNLARITRAIVLASLASGERSAAGIGGL